MSTDNLEPLDVLEGRLQTFKSQVLQIEALISVSEPSQVEALTKLTNDLRTAIDLTNSLIALHNPILPIIADSASIEVNRNIDNNDNREGSNNEDDIDDDELDAACIAQVGPLKVGDIIEVKSSATRTYAGVITGLESSAEGVPTPDTARVKYFEYESEVYLPLADIARIAPGPLQRKDISPGWIGECKFATDNKYYSCVVESLASHGCRVRYPQYGIAEEAPLAYLRPAANSSSGSGGKVAGNTPAVTAEKEKEKKIIPIPEYLEIKPTDTEEEKVRKLKKIKAIKSKNRLVRREQEQNETQQSWQKFVQKGTKRGITGIKESSMFASSEGGRVGVVGSGKETTGYGERKRYKFDAPLQEEEDD